MVKPYLRDAEWLVYVTVALLAGVLCFVVLVAQPDHSGDWGETLRLALFNVVAIATTTGFTTTDFAVWPSVCQVGLLGLMFMGAMGGSTGGGFKVVRVIVLAKHTVGEFRRVLHPQAVIVTRIGRRPVRPDTFLKVVGLFALYIGTHGTGTILLAAMGYDFITSVSASLAAMSSIGPGLGLVGPAGNYGELLPGAQLTLSALMLMGRLEFYTLLVLFMPGTWRGTIRGRGKAQIAGLSPG